MLRITSTGGIPTDNPFFNQATGDNRAIWALGVRNPFTFSFQPGIGRMFINDVGQNTWEEINDGIAGSNYGWPTCEGFCNPPNPSFRDPIFAYMNDALNMRDHWRRVLQPADSVSFLQTLSATISSLISVAAG